MGFAIAQFFNNGGADALMIRVHHASAANAEDRAEVDLPSDGGRRCTCSRPVPAPGGTGCRRGDPARHGNGVPPHGAGDPSANPAEVLTEERFLQLRLTAGVRASSPTC